MPTTSSLFSFRFLCALAAMCVIGGTSNRLLAQEGDFASAQEQLQAVLEAGQQQFADGDFAAAAESFSQVVTASGGYQPGPLLLRAKAYAQLEEYEAALEDLKNALTYGQSQPALLPEIQNTRAEVYMEIGAFQQALPDLEAATKANRSNPQYQFNLGKTYIKLGAPNQAEKALTKYLEAEVEDDEEQRGEALSYRGQAFGYLGKKEKANADFEAALAIDPENHETYFSRASVALQDKEYAAAAVDLRKSIENYTPEDEEDELPFGQAYLTLASVYEELGKEAATPEEATAAYMKEVAVCNELIDLLDEDDPRLGSVKAAVYFRLGVGQRLLNQYGPAINSFSIALQNNPVMGEAYFRRGICFFYLGEERLAIRDFEQSASISYDSPRANLWKGMAWAKMGNLNEAIRAYGESVAVSDRYIPAFVNRGLAHLKQEDYTKAIDDFNEAIRLQPTEASHYYRRGRAYSLSGDREKAIRSLMIAVQLDKNLAPAYSAIADELKADGQWQLAEEYRRRASELGNFETNR